MDLNSFSFFMISTPLRAITSSLNLAVDSAIPSVSNPAC
nr:MAG TPA: hypothetical protein [Caudoviricetes sp.]